jgi:hypothetical protein
VDGREGFTTVSPTLQLDPVVKAEREKEREERERGERERERERGERERPAGFAWQPREEAGAAKEGSQELAREVTADLPPAS